MFYSGERIVEILQVMSSRKEYTEVYVNEVKELMEFGYPECMDHPKLLEEMKLMFFVYLDLHDSQQIKTVEAVIRQLLWIGNAQTVWSILIARVPKVRDSHLLSSLLQILRQCSELDVTTSKHEVMEIVSTVDCFRMNKTFLKIMELVLVIYRRKNTADVIKVRLDVLSESHTISEEFQNVAVSVIHLAYLSLENCLTSNSVINTLLFLNSESTISGDLSESFEKVQNMNCENWLQRSLLHLAVMFCSKKSILERIPNSLVSSFIEEKDLHGCTPLHLAYLWGNKESVDFLLSHGAETDVTDHFGITPMSLGLRVGVTETDGHLETVPSKFQSTDVKFNHVDVLYQQRCKRVMQAESNVLESMKPMIVLPEEDRNLQSGDVKRLFERLVTQLPDLLQGEVQVAGSSRERLKAGRLDEVDVQIRLHILSHSICKVKRGFFVDKKEELDQEALGEWLHASLLSALPYIKWHDIPLRLISVKHPWQFIYERPGQTHCVQFSVDVVPIITIEKDIKVADPLHTKLLAIQQRQQLIIPDAQIHNPMWFLRWGNFSRRHMLLRTYCEYEWDILDSLPTDLRVGISLVKAFLEVKVLFYCMQYSKFWFLVH